MLRVLMKIVWRAGSIKKTRKASGFEISHVWASFSNDFIAVKGLSRLKQLTRLKVGWFVREGRLFCNCSGRNRNKTDAQTVSF